MASEVIGKKRGPKSEKDVFLMATAGTLRSIMPEKCDGEINGMANDAWEKHLREKDTIRRAGKSGSKLARDSEAFMLACKAFGPFLVKNNTEKGENRDLSRISDTYGKLRYQGKEVYAGELEVGQNQEAFAPDGFLRKFADFLYAWGSSESRSIREGTHNRNVLTRVVNGLRNLGLDGAEVSKVMLPALVAGLSTLADELGEPEDIEEEDDGETEDEVA